MENFGIHFFSVAFLKEKNKKALGGVVSSVIEFKNNGKNV